MRHKRSENETDEPTVRKDWFVFVFIIEFEFEEDEDEEFEEVEDEEIEGRCLGERTSLRSKREIAILHIGHFLLSVSRYLKTQVALI